MNPDALLELVGLLHPDGCGDRVAVIGPGRDDTPRQETDLILLVPSSSQWRDSRWRARVLAALSPRLGSDGVVFALAPGRLDRRSMLAGIRGSGLNVVERVAVLPELRRARQLMPITPRAVEHELVRCAPRTRRLARLAARTACATGGLELLAPTVGYLAQRAGSRQPVAWLQPPQAAGHGDWLVRGSWRGRHDPTVVLRLDETSLSLAMVAKVTSDEAAGAEARMLRTVAATATSNGVRTPQVRDLTRLGKRLALVEEPLDGEPAAVWLAHRPQRLKTLVAALVAWLERWATESRQDAVLARSELEALVLAPAQRLATHLGDGDEYVDWLTELGEGLVGTRLARTSAHRDLTMWNVLVSRSGRLGVLDWAESEPTALPLGDLAYSIVDAVGAVSGYRSRQAAFASCFASDQAQPYAVPLMRRLGTRLGLSAPAQALCLHACWLGHAVNELRRDDGCAGPFVDIVRQLAQQRDVIASTAVRS